MFETELRTLVESVAGVPDEHLIATAKGLMRVTGINAEDIEATTTRDDAITSMGLLALAVASNPVLAIGPELASLPPGSEVSLQVNVSHKNESEGTSTG